MQRIITVDIEKYIAEAADEFSGEFSTMLRDSWGDENSPDAITEAIEEYGFSADAVKRVMFAFKTFVNSRMIINRSEYDYDYLSKRKP